MSVYLFSLLLATSTWPGVWKITAEKLEGGFATFYLVIEAEDSAELYDHQWYPQHVKTFELDEATVEMAINFDHVIVPTVLRASLEDRRFSGTITVNFPQYEIKSEISAEKVVDRPIAPPAKQIPGLIDGQTVNIVQYMVQNAPREGFDEFSRFWRNDLIPRYFVLMEPLLTETEDGIDKTLKGIYESLEALENKASERLLSGFATDVDFTVLVPAAEEREPLTIEVYSEKKEWPPDHEPCCGEKLFNAKKFRLVSVAP